MSEWTTAEDLIAQVERLWHKGALLRGVVEESPAALRLRFRRPSSDDLANRFDDVRVWIRSLESRSKEVRGFGYDLKRREIAHRQIGKNRLPVAAEITSLHDAARLVGREREFDAFVLLVSQTRARRPALLTWLARNPLFALERCEAWDRVLSALDWLTSNPGSGLYVRQIDIPGIDTKFIEAQRDLLLELTRALGIEVGVGSSLEATWGLRQRPRMVRFRILDARLNVEGFSDIAVPIEDFARHPIAAKHVFVVENEVNGLAFPETPDSIVVFGLGYGAEMLRMVEWMQGSLIHYWGDIDTHGFAILDRVRSVFPNARSFLMDRETLLTHRDSWVREASPSERVFVRLTVGESALVEELRNNTHGIGVRLEQERIRFTRVAQAVAECTSVPSMAESPYLIPSGPVLTKQL
jgi:hypothetical protein